MASGQRQTVHTLLGYSIKRAQHGLRVRLDKEFAALGLTTPQYTALAFLETAGPSSNAELARAGFVTPQTMHAILAGLQTAGLVSRGPHPHHAKIVLLDLNAKGRRTLAEAHALAEALEKHAFEGLDGAEKKQLLRDLTRIADRLDDSDG